MGAEFGYDFENNAHEPSKNNILHYAALLGDVEVIKWCMQNRLNGLCKMLNAQNMHKKLPIHCAMDMENICIVELFLNCNEQTLDIQQLIDRDIFNNSKWLHCFSDIISKSNGKVLEKFDSDSKRALLVYATHTLNMKNSCESKKSVSRPLTPKKQFKSSKMKKMEEEKQALTTIILFLHKALKLSPRN